MKRILAVVIVLMLAAAPPPTAPADSSPGAKSIDQMTTKELRELVKSQRSQIADLTRQRDLLEAQVKKLGATPATAGNPAANPLTFKWVHEADRTAQGGELRGLVLMQIKISNEGPQSVDVADFRIDCIDADGDVIDRSRYIYPEDL